MEKSEYFLITAWDGKSWSPDELAERTPISRVRQILGGRWERSIQYHPFIKAFFSGSKHVLVLGFPPGKTRAEAEAALEAIRQGRLVEGMN